MTRPLIIIGSGGHASVLVDSLRMQQRELVAIVTPDSNIQRSVFDGILQYLDDDDILRHDLDKISLVNGLGDMPGVNTRYKIFKRFSELGFKFENVIAPDAIISPFAKLGHGVQVMAGAIIQAGSVIGDNTIINTGAIIDHDCVIGAHNHIAPGVTLSGQVMTGDYVHIGTGASIINSVTVGASSVVGIGTVIYKNLPAQCIVHGECENTVKSKR